MSNTREQTLTHLEDVGLEFGCYQKDLEESRQRLYSAIVGAQMLYKITDAELARVTGVSRTTVRKALGK